MCVGGCVSQLSSPVARVWRHVGGKLDLLDISSTSIPDCGGPTQSSPTHSSLPGLPAGLMMLHFNDQLYLQPMHSWPVAVATTGCDNKQV